MIDRVDGEVVWHVLFYAVTHTHTHTPTRCYAHTYNVSHYLIPPCRSNISLSFPKKGSRSYGSRRVRTVLHRLISHNEPAEMARFRAVLPCDVRNTAPSGSGSHKDPFCCSRPFFSLSWLRPRNQSPTEGGSGVWALDGGNLALNSSLDRGLLDGAAIGNQQRPEPHQQAAAGLRH